MSRVIYIGLDNQQWSTRSSSSGKQPLRRRSTRSLTFFAGLGHKHTLPQSRLAGRLGVWWAWTARSLPTVALGGSAGGHHICCQNHCVSPFRQRKTPVCCCCLRDDDDDDKCSVLHATLPPWSWHVPSQVSAPLLKQWSIHWSSSNLNQTA